MQRHRCGRSFKLFILLVQVKLPRRRKYWRCKSRKECNMVRRLYSKANEADEAPDTVTGDIVFVLQQKEHPNFKRKYDDLYVEHTLSLTEALCGFQFALTHLDGRQLLIKSNPGEVVKPDSGVLSPDQCRLLETFLPPRLGNHLSDMELDECEETTLYDVNIEEEMRRKQQQEA